VAALETEIVIKLMEGERVQELGCVKASLHQRCNAVWFGEAQKAEASIGLELYRAVAWCSVFVNNFI
jgi:hypothetical protein